MTLKEACKKVITQNESLGFHPEIFIFQTKRCEAKNLELVISDLVRNKNTEEEIVEAIKKYGDVTTVEDKICEEKGGFGLPDDVIAESKRRKEVFDWYRKLKK